MKIVKEGGVMKKNNKFLIIAILLAGTLGSVGAYYTFNGNRENVLVASQTIRGNTELTSNMIAEKSIEKESLPKNYISAKYANDVIGRYTDLGITEGGVLTTDNVATGDGSRSSVIAKGYTVLPIQLESLPSGIKAGDYVNILIGTTSADKGKVVLTYQKIMVTNVLKDGDKNLTGIEVQVTPKQAQKIQYANLNGSLSISLLNGEYKKEDLNVVDENQFLSGK